jgi:hypothetical protein
MAGVGAWGEDDPQYRGEAYVAEGHGTATIEAWTPNAVEVRVDGAKAGDRVVLNQNWDPGWRADDAPAASYQDAVAAVLTSPSQTVRFHYWPRGMTAGLAIFAAALAGALLWTLRRREARA